MDTPRTVEGFRKLTGTTQARLADMLGVSERTVRRWEAGETEPPHAILLALTVLWDDFKDYSFLEKVLQRTGNLPPMSEYGVPGTSRVVSYILGDEFDDAIPLGHQMEALELVARSCVVLHMESVEGAVRRTWEEFINDPDSDLWPYVRRDYTPDTHAALQSSG